MLFLLVSKTIDATDTIINEAKVIQGAEPDCLQPLTTSKTPKVNTKMIKVYL